MESVKKAKDRLWTLYPKLLVSCGPEATAYAACVTAHMGEVQKHQCEAEFQKFKACIQASAKKNKAKF